jgi:hypothetical protein
MKTIKTYSEVAKLDSFEARFRYLALDGIVGDQTFGHQRFTNQAFYRSQQWRNVRNLVMVRDDSCDLGVPGRVIHGNVYIHHINPLTPDDLRYGRPCLLDPENLITVSHDTHNAIHFGDESQLRQDPVERRPGDHLPWR